MKSLKYSIAVFVIGMLFNIGSYAQNSIIGTLENYTNNEGLIMSYDLITRDRISYGTIDNEGEFTIPLKEDYLEMMLKKAKEVEEKALSNGKISLNTMASTFICDFNNENKEYLDDGTEKVTYTGSNKKNEIIYKNGEAIIMRIPDLFITDKNKVSSILYAVSDPEIANWLFYYGDNIIVKGSYLQWFFVEGEVSAIGVCVIPTYTGNNEENYMNVTNINLKLQKGWNIIKYNITEIFTDVNNKTYASKTEISNVTEIPNDVKWVKVIYQ